MILFLDFDGVTHSDGCFSANFFCRLPLIEEVLREFPSVKIVISSSWRDHHPLDTLMRHFAGDMRTRVIGATPNAKRIIDRITNGGLPDPKIEFERQWECEFWLEENRRWAERWVAIDDRPEWFEPACPHLLLTKPATGFQAGDQATLCQMLRSDPTVNPEAAS